jgi:hypothetical protein
MNRQVDDTGAAWSIDGPAGLYHHAVVPLDGITAAASASSKKCLDSLKVAAGAFHLLTAEAHRMRRCAQARC